jgi:hypothetical protein
MASRMRAVVSCVTSRLCPDGTILKSNNLSACVVIIFPVDCVATKTKN